MRMRVSVKKREFKEVGTEWGQSELAIRHDECENIYLRLEMENLGDGNAADPFQARMWI